MAVAIQPAVERRNQVSHLIQELVHERQQVWSLYCRVAEFKPFSSSEEHVKKILAEFCQILIDYISLGHFGIYQRILEGKERRKAVLRAAETIYPDIADTTEAAVTFNDKYETADRKKLVESLESDLSALGEKLAIRIEAEDRLCKMLMH